MQNDKHYDKNTALPFPPPPPIFQKAMLGGGAERELLELPIAKASLEMTEEMMLKKTEKNRKRRIQAQKRKERRKARTHCRPGCMFQVYIQAFTSVHVHPACEKYN